MSTTSHVRPRRRIVAGVASLAAAALALSACAAPASTDGASDGDFSGQTLSALLITSHEGAANWLKENFEAETGATVDLTIVPYDEIGSTLALDQQSGANTIDVAAPWYVSIGDLAAGGSIQDLTEWIESTPSLEEDDFIQSIYDPYTLVDGKRYGLPFDGDTHVLFYNTEILERNGITEPPATWDEYLEDVKIITENEGANGVYGSAIFGQKSPLILGAAYANRLAGFGGSFVDEDGKPTINSPEAVAAAQALVDAVPYAFPTPAETDFGVGNGAWYDGKVGFIENWTDLGVGSETNPDSTVAGKWGVTTLPVGGDNTESRASLVAGFTWVISANTEKTDLAKAFIEFAASSEVNSELIVADPQTGIDPNRVSSLESAAYGETYSELQEVNRATLAGSLAWPTGENASQAAQILTDELAKLIAGEGGTAQETLDRVQAEWEEILG
ncbi:multiple sugar transport system substrate-binding protein [Microbacteriaceae bacterium SG_E_30_P1]|uniref:Multiple sugar transport system substrate-binding protein n=1 Tax=Antiquaquibacter oligotrophicus TaxID=2880260 RepID=A0ABT6KNY9_9MICO|nr:sugar ABC transporter substrate-binding protein [Antiquaquibacter oligotrophicus]MDH6181711.1 multiple sugar transport system substrate-binding protein [Antiquaquibacter oligotrophicus]UDF12606.1 sugar ABC transporter substrate-binding protein [Antiquaquibacter oligotrophicus]